MKKNDETLERLFRAARNASIPPRPEAPLSLSRNILREIRLLKPEKIERNTAHPWETLSTAAVSVGALIAIACTIAGRSNDHTDSTLSDPAFIANEFIQQSIDP